MVNGRSLKEREVAKEVGGGRNNDLDEEYLLSKTIINVRERWKTVGTELILTGGDVKYPM